MEKLKGIVVISVFIFFSTILLVDVFEYGYSRECQDCVILGYVTNTVENDSD